MKKFVTTSLAALLLLASLASCKTGDSSSSQSNSSGSPSSSPSTDTSSTTPEITLTELITFIKQQAEAEIGEDGLPMSEERDVTEENCQNHIGVPFGDYEKYAVAGLYSQAAIMSVPHEIALVECKDPESAGKLKNGIAAGFNAGKWVCVRPDKCIVATSGKYVILVVTRKPNVDPILNAFKAKLGSMDEPLTFFDADIDEWGGGTCEGFTAG